MQKWERAFDTEGVVSIIVGFFLNVWTPGRSENYIYLFIYIQAFIAFFHMVWCVIYQGYNQQRNGGESGQKEMVAGIAPGLQILYLSTPLSL